LDISVNSAAALNVQLENPLSVSDWNRRLAGNPHGSFFHTTEWARVLNLTYGFAPIYFTGAQSNALLPLMEIDSWLTGRRGVSLPFTDQCEPLGDSKAVTAMFKEALKVGRSRQWKYLESHGSGSVVGLPGSPGPSLEFFAHELPLNSSPEKLVEGFDTSVRRAIRKAESAGLTVEISTSPKAIREFYSLHCQTRREHGVPPQPFRFFRNIQKEVLAKNLGAVISAKEKDRPVASAVFFRFGDEAIYKFGASDRTCLHLRGNNLVMSEAIKWCASQGSKVLNFGRTSLNNEGLRRFKLGWGAKESRIQYFRYDLRTNAYVQEQDRSSGWHSRFFRNMPLFMSRLCGMVLYRHMG
jgi:hypothetical protein